MTSHEKVPDGGRYVVRVAGHLHPRWAAQLQGMELAAIEDGTTVLEGDVADQAALHGLLRSVRDLGLPLISLTRVGPTSFEPIPAPSTTQGGPS